MAKYERFKCIGNSLVYLYRSFASVRKRSPKGQALKCAEYKDPLDREKYQYRFN